MKEKMLKVSELIEHLKIKNVKFNYINENQAESYLTNNNNYFNLYSYKNNFQRYSSGKNIGKFIDLDFAYLKDLSVIDMKLRFLLFKMIVDIEHYLKIKILNKIEKIDEEDGYKIVNLYLSTELRFDKKTNNIQETLYKKLNSNYVKDIMEKYLNKKTKKFENIPIWEFLEMITFGELIDFYSLFIKEYSLKKEDDLIYILKEIVKLRNAIAHNNCILSNLSVKDNEFNPTISITKQLKEFNISTTTIKNKLHNSRIRQLTYLFLIYNNLVSSKDRRIHISKEINKFFNKRIIMNKNYYKNNSLLKSFYNYFYIIIKKNYKYK